MKIRTRILLYFTASTLAVIGIAFVMIYILFAEYREEEFQQRLKEKITFTLQFLDEEIASNKSLLHTLDRLTINQLYEEKTLLFDKHKQLIYTSLDDVSITYSQQLLDQLSPESPWIETQEGNFDVVGLCLHFENNQYYGITKAYDTFGYTKLNYLKYALVAIFIAITALVVLIALYISRQISRPIHRMATEIGELNLETEKQKLTIPPTRDEIQLLGEKFNELMNRLRTSFSFQKHAIHHISHELKTPIAVLVSNFERIENESNPDLQRILIQQQKESTRDLGQIINALLELSKAESGNFPLQDEVRMDDLIFDVAEEIKLIHPQANFQVQIDHTLNDENKLTVIGNLRLLKSAISNLLQNSIQYSKQSQSIIQITHGHGQLIVNISNDGPTISPQQQPYMFKHFFRGENSKGTMGFGLGLVWIGKVMELHQGTIRYQSDENMNRFEICLPHKH